MLSLAVKGSFRSALAYLHGLAPEVVAARSAQPVAGEQLDRGQRACPPLSLSLSYSPTALAAFSRNSKPCLML